MSGKHSAASSTARRVLLCVRNFRARAPRLGSAVSVAARRLEPLGVLDPAPGRAPTGGERIPPRSLPTARLGVIAAGSAGALGTAGLLLMLVHGLTLGPWTFRPGGLLDRGTGPSGPALVRVLEGPLAPASGVEAGGGSRYGGVVPAGSALEGLLFLAGDRAGAAAAAGSQAAAGSAGTVAGATGPAARSAGTAPGSGDAPRAGSGGSSGPGGSGGSGSGSDAPVVSPPPPIGGGTGPGGGGSGGTGGTVEGVADQVGRTAGGALDDATQQVGGTVGPTAETVGDTAGGTTGGVTGDVTGGGSGGGSGGGGIAGTGLVAPALPGGLG